jgi:hypothetical protein
MQILGPYPGPAHDRVGPLVDEFCEGVFRRLFQQEWAIWIFFVQIGGDIPGVANDAFAINQHRDEVLSGKRQFLVAMTAKLDVKLELLMEEGHSHPPAIGAKSPPGLVNEVIENDGHENYMLRSIDVRRSQ